jgi:hypothetical protein
VTRIPPQHDSGHQWDDCLAVSLTFTEDGGETVVLLTVTHKDGSQDVIQLVAVRRGRLLASVLRARTQEAPMTHALSPRRWVGHDAEAVAWTEPDGTIAVLRCGRDAASSGKAWVDRVGRPGSYEYIPSEVVAFCRRCWPCPGAQ